MLITFLVSFPHHDSTFNDEYPPVWGELVSDLSEENYEQPVSNYRFWTKIGATYGSISNDQLHSDILVNMKPDPVYPLSWNLIHRISRLLLQLISVIDIDPVSTTHAQICHTSLCDFFSRNLEFIPRDDTTVSLGMWSSFYTKVNFIAQLVNLG